MSVVHRHNPARQQKLLHTCLHDTPAAVLSLLRSLSVAEFRTAGWLLGENVLPQLDSARFWELFNVVVASCSKAYLGTFLKGAVRLRQRGKLQWSRSVLAPFVGLSTAIDRRKMLEQLLPTCQTADEAEELLCALGDETYDESAPTLLRLGTPWAYWLLFQWMRRHEGDRELLRDCGVRLVRKGDRLSFNMAAIVRQYFDITSIPGTFSLNLPPYAQGRMERSPENFLKVLQS